MSLSGNMMSEVPDSATLSRAFGELFSGAKETFDGCRRSWPGFLPSMPGMPVGKFGDLSVGIDMHPTVTLRSPVMAVPHVGKVYDIMAEIMAGLAAECPNRREDRCRGGCNGQGDGAIGKGTRKVDSTGRRGSAPAAGIRHTPRTHGERDCRSGNVHGKLDRAGDGAPCSTLTHPTLSCNIAGIPSIPRANKPKKAAKACRTDGNTDDRNVGRKTRDGGRTAHNRPLRRRNEARAEGTRKDGKEIRELHQKVHARGTRIQTSLGLNQADEDTEEYRLHRTG